MDRESSGFPFISLESRFWVWLPGVAAGKLLPNSPGWCRPKWGGRQNGQREGDGHKERKSGKTRVE